MTHKCKITTSTSPVFCKCPS